MEAGSEVGEVARARTLIVSDAPVVAPALALVALMVLWAAHDGGYDLDTWYWGALVALGILTAVLAAVGVGSGLRGSRPLQLAVAAFAGYVIWSYLSITWAEAKGAALDGSNRALLYLIIFSLFAALRWDERTALSVLLVFTLAIGAIAEVVLLDLAGGHGISRAFDGGRLSTPTNYYNASAALFTMLGLLGTGLSSRRSLPPVLRGALAAFACGGLQLALLGQSRGWLFTLPLVALAAILVVRDRLRVTLHAAIVVAGALPAVPRLLHVFDASPDPGQPFGPFVTAAERAGKAGLATCGAVLIVVTALAVADSRRPLKLTAALRRRLGVAVCALAFAGFCGAALAATHGDPFDFVSRQWHGFTHNTTSTGSGSHFTQVGSGRYDFWRVAWHATVTHPVGGLGQDNFADFYVSRRRTYEEPAWTHSLEMRLLTHTGFVGFALFALFLVAALRAVAVSLRAASPARAIAGLATLPLVVWLLHGSVDWFWEMPALSGPALAFLGMAAALQPASALTPALAPPALGPPPTAAGAGSRRARARYLRLLPPVAGGAALLGATYALAFPYLSVREISSASNETRTNPLAALRDLRHAASLDPLNALPGRLAGSIDLQIQRYTDAERHFRQSLARDPGGWFAWLGDGLAASMLGDRTRARHDFEIAHAINSQQPPIQDALARVDSARPLTPVEALQELVSES